MANAKQITYLSQAQYDQLVANRTITVGGVTVTYNEDDLYVTPQADPTVVTENISGPEVTINAADNHCYVCGTLSSLTLTAPASGMFDVTFTSGTSVTAMVTSGIIFPEWFEGVKAGYHYEINVNNGYGAVMSWPI